MDLARRLMPKQIDSGPGSMLGPRVLNRALLERQFLLRRAKLPALDAVERLVGLQAQSPSAPYVGLWSRLEGFRFDDLAGLISRREVVRVVLMRSTIHLVTADDCLALRPVMQSVLDRGLKGNFGRRLQGVDLDQVAAAGRVPPKEVPAEYSGSHGGYWELFGWNLFRGLGHDFVTSLNMGR
jgi:hypothetical protein